MTISHVKGAYRDVIRGSGGQVRDSGWHSNLIVRSCRELLAAFMQNGQANISGLHLIKLGRGLDSWDTEPPLPADELYTSLADENPFEIPVEPGQIIFLDSGNQPQEQPTHRLELSLILGPGVPEIPDGETSVPLREFGLFGEIGGQLYMINYVRHPVIRKKEDDTLERTIRLVF